MLGQALEREYALTDLLRRPGVTYASLHDAARAPAPPWTTPRSPSRSRSSTKYAGYIDRQHEEVARQLARRKTLRIPADLDYRDVRGLSTEVAAEARTQHQAGNDRPGGAHLRHHAGGDLAAARASEARRDRRAARRRHDARDVRRADATHVDLARGLDALGARARRRRSAAQLAAYLALLAKWNRTYNLTAIREPARMVTHHLLDALAVLPRSARDRTTLRVLDVGSRRRRCPASRSRSRGRTGTSTMVDPNHKKAAFLTQAAIELRLRNASRARGARRRLRAGDAPFDVVISRAFADLATFAATSARARRAATACSSR